MFFYFVGSRSNTLDANSAAAQTGGDANSNSATNANASNNNSNNNNGDNNNDANFDDDSMLAKYVVHMQANDNLQAFKQVLVVLFIETRF